MRRLLVASTAAAGLRFASSLGDLVKAQTALTEKKKVPAGAAKDFAAFLRIKVPNGKGAAAATETYFRATLDQTAAEEEGSAVREQEGVRRAQEDLPVFLLGYSFSSKRIVLYSVSIDRVVAEHHAVDDDAWALADTLLGFTRGSREFIIIPVVEATRDRRLLLPVVEKFTATLKGCGLLPVARVDTLEMAETLERDPPALTDIVGSGAAAPAALSEKWFRAQWVLLRTLACKAVDADPVHTINTYILPRFDVYVIHLVRAGSRGMNVSLWNPLRRRRYIAKGMLSDTLACLFSTQSKRFTLIPTNRTDRALLFRCRAALIKAGHHCVLVFASEMDERYRRVFQSDPSRYWLSLREASGALDADLHLQVCGAAGNTLRTYHRKMLLEGKHARLLDAVQAKKGADGSDDGADDEMAPMTDVEQWLSIFNSPKRQAREKAEGRHYRKYLAVAYTATEYLAYGQPRNPLAPQNGIVCASLTDHTGAVLEPWVKYGGRGLFTLPSLDDYEVLVVHDAKRFLLLLGYENAELQKFLRRGGRVWCTMLAEYLVDAQRSRTGSNALSEVALKYGFLLPPSSRVGSQADDLPLAFHRRHLLAAAPAIVAVFTQQVQLAVQQCQLVSVAHRMDALLAMTSIEWSGVHVDVDEADRQSKALGNAAAVLDKALSAFVPPEVPFDMRGYFDWGSLPQLHAFFFGGSITIGRGSQARSSRQWSSNLVHLCHRYGALPDMVGDVHLQRFAAENGVSTVKSGGGNKLPARVAAHIDSEGSQKRKKYRLVVFDVETTGLNATTDELIEIAMFDPVENTTFTSLVKPLRRISPRTVEIHHITDEAVRGAPSAEEVARGVVEYLRLDAAQRDPDEVVVLLGHNVFGLDEPMLQRLLTTHTPDADYEGILYCDSVVLLRALKTEMHNTRLQRKKVDPALLEALTSSLRLGTLIEKLHVTPEGQLHRADTDTRALWFVLVNAFGLAGQKAARQREALLTAAARTLVFYPATGCFVPSERKQNTQQVQLPGIARAVMKNHSKLVSSLQAKPFSEKVLEVLFTHGVKVAGLLLQRMGLERHSSRFLQASQDRSLSVLHPDQAVHQHVDMTATTTSRTTSAFPSLQNIPKDDKSAVRRLFVSRFGAKGRCVEIDYSQLEIVVLAVLCRDASLMRDLNSGVDFHVKRAEFFSGLPYKEIYEGYKRDVPKYVKLRKTAKQFSFQRLYGAGVPLLHKTTGIPVEDLEASIRMEAEAYPGIAQFHRITRSVALRPNNPGLPTNFIVEMPTGQRMSFRTRDVILNLPPLKNYPIQGYGAELAQMMLGRVLRHFLKKKYYGGRAFLTNFVHDSVWLDCHVDVLQECVSDTARILSSVHQYVPEHFPGVEVCVPLSVSSSCGVDMCSMQSTDSGFTGVRQQKRRSADLGPAALLPTPSASAAALAAEAATGDGSGEVAPGDPLSLFPGAAMEDDDDDAADAVDAARRADDSDDNDDEDEDGALPITDVELV